MARVVDDGHGGRPGLLLLWHGDFPEGFLDSAVHRALYQKCLSAREALQSYALSDRPNFEDDYARAGLFISYHLLSRLKPEHLELSHLGLRSPGLRQSIYRTAARGARRIICSGAAGLMLPGHGPSDRLPDELHKVIRDNPALDLVMASPALDGEDIARIVRQSLEFSFRGTQGRWKMAERSFRCLEDRGIVLVSGHDHAALPGTPAAVEALSGIYRRMSEMSKKAYADAGDSAMGGIVRQAGERLLAAGLPAVESGFMDFALPDVAEAAGRLLDAGCTHIVAAGVPALLHRHPYSFMGPSAAVELLGKKLPGTDIVYVQPDPEPIAPYLADVIMSGVLEADENGQSLAMTLRKR